MHETYLKNLQIDKKINFMRIREIEGRRSSSTSYVLSAIPSDAWNTIWVTFSTQWHVKLSIGQPPEYLPLTSID